MRSEVEYLDDDEGNDFISLGRDLLAKIPFKKAAILSIFMILIFSTVFIHTVLSRIPNSVELNTPNTKGTLIQITVVVIIYIIIDVLVSERII